MTYQMRQRIDYFKWSLTRLGDTDVSCPACGSPATRVVGRKYLVTALRECQPCRLRFRVPKEEPEQAGAFYQNTYQEGMTTRMPSDDELADLLKAGFAGTVKDFTPYIEVCRALGMKRGARLLDFGCSWGYGSWQFRQAGFDVWSSEISVPRREFARTKLQCRLLEDLGSVAGSIDCFFSAHVIEHLPNPGIIFRIARAALTDTGVMVTFCPNGDPESSWSNHYSDLWGRKHPLVITPEFINQNCRKYGFTARMYSEPYNLEAIARGDDGGALSGEELCIVMRRDGRG